MPCQGSANYGLEPDNIVGPWPNIQLHHLLYSYQPLLPGPSSTSLLSSNGTFSLFFYILHVLHLCPLDRFVCKYLDHKSVSSQALNKRALNSLSTSLIFFNFHTASLLLFKSSLARAIHLLWEFDSHSLKPPFWTSDLMTLHPMNPSCVRVLRLLD